MLIKRKNCHPFPPSVCIFYKEPVLHCSAIVQHLLTTIYTIHIQSVLDCLCSQKSLVAHKKHFFITLQRMIDSLLWSLMMHKYKAAFRRYLKKALITWALFTDTPRSWSYQVVGYICHISFPLPLCWQAFLT